VIVLRTRPLNAESFAPFGDVLTAPSEIGRETFDGALANLRSDARLSLALVHKAPTALPQISRIMERHRWSSQTFLPLQAKRWLVIVAPHNEDRTAPDMDKALAFIASGQQGVTFAADVWHHPFTVLESPAKFAVATWKNGNTDDDEFVDTPEFLIEHSEG
jgi:ureidoglycolate lyase